MKLFRNTGALQIKATKGLILKPEWMSTILDKI